MIGGVYDIPVASEIGGVSETYLVEKRFLDAREVVGVGVEVL
jgi:hypothetical protein